MLLNYRHLHLMVVVQARLELKVRDKLGVVVVRDVHHSIPGPDFVVGCHKIFFVLVINTFKKLAVVNYYNTHI